MEASKQLPPPYYQDDYVTIYHGDCREIVPELGPDSIDLVLTDPPYGICDPKFKLKKGSLSTIRAKGNYLSNFDDTPNYIKSVVVPLIELCAEHWPVVLTPGIKNFFLYPPADSFGCFYQPASVGLQTWGNADSQPILYYGKNPTKKAFGKALSFQLTESPDKNGHPCPKPLGVWKKLLSNVSLFNHTILDPFMGSGTTLRAAKDLGRKAVGIELEERYCEIAAMRMQQEVFNFGSTEPAAPPPQLQPELLGETPMKTGEGCHVA